MSTAAQIAEALAGQKVKSYGGNFLVRCPTHDDNAPSLSIRDTDRGVQVHCFADCSPGAIYAAIRRIGCKLEPSDTAREPRKDSSEYKRRQHDKAAWLWAQRKPIVGSIAETYLRKARGYTGPLPATLGLLPALKPEHHPTMIAAFAIPDESEPGTVGKPQHVTSVHLTLLMPDGSAKADAKPNKVIIGSPRGRPIVTAPPNDLLGLAITEGIEDALTVHQETGLGAWAAGSAGFMPALAENVPSYVEAVTIFAHADKAGQDGARKLARALDRRGIEVRVEGMS
jgi:Toprim domain